MWDEVALISASYLLGSVPTLSLLARVHRAELRGDFHAGLWQVGKALFVIGIAAEFAKGAVPVVVARYLGFSPAIVALAGLSAVVGQMWPVFARFDGEKGNSIGLAMMLTLVPLPSLIALIPVLSSVLIRSIPRLRDRRSGQLVLGGNASRSLPLGMAAGFIMLPLACLALREPAGVTIICAALFVVIMVRRMTAGLLADLQQGGDIKRIILDRLLYDRPSVAWRREITAA